MRCYWCCESVLILKSKKCSIKLPANFIATPFFLIEKENVFANHLKILKSKMSFNKIHANFIVTLFFNLKKILWTSKLEYFNFWWHRRVLSFKIFLQPFNDVTELELKIFPSSLKTSHGVNLEFFKVAEKWVSSKTKPIFLKSKNNVLNMFKMVLLYIFCLFLFCFKHYDLALIVEFSLDIHVFLYLSTEYAWLQIHDLLSVFKNVFFFSQTPMFKTYLKHCLRKFGLKHYNLEICFKSTDDITYVCGRQRFFQKFIPKKSNSTVISR